MTESAPLMACFDESSGKGFTVVAGWIASVEQWDHFEVDWNLFLISYKVPYLHMKEYSQSVGPFAKWKGSPHVRARFLHDAWEIIGSRVRKGLVCCVQDVLFNRINRFYRLDERFPSCYALAGRECMAWANRQATSAREEVRCIFDDGGPDKNGLIDSVDIEPRLPRPVFEPSRDVPDRKRGTRRGRVQIQAADFLAYELRKYAVDHALIRTGRRTPRKPLEMFGQKRPDTKFFTEQRLLEQCEAFGIERRVAVA